ncbi:MAG: GntR family transcriptional regulator [Anaerolineaceae bacterium]|nr:GntR family transcriptional regulator [Anaerolineaceae bacterium]
MTYNHGSDPFSGQIDKTSPVPYHYQLREIIRAEITGNRFSPGDQLPSENQLCDLFQLSRTTVREALDALVTEGLLTREKGVGTFVAHPKFMEAWSGTSIGFSDSINKQGYLIETRVLELKITPVSHAIRQELQLLNDENVILLRRLRYILKQPVLVVNSYLPEKLFPNLLSIDFSNRSLYQTFRKDYGVEILRVKRSIEAIAAETVVAQLLEVDPGFPIMFIENTAYSDNGLPVEFYTAWRRGDKSRFQFEYNLPPVTP